MKMLNFESTAHLTDLVIEKKFLAKCRFRPEAMNQKNGESKKRLVF